LEQNEPVIGQGATEDQKLFMFNRLCATSNLLAASEGYPSKSAGIASQMSVDLY
jgi:hypothetical protein